MTGSLSIAMTDCNTKNDHDYRYSLGGNDRNDRECITVSMMEIQVTTVTIAVAIMEIYELKVNITVAVLENTN